MYVQVGFSSTSKDLVRVSAGRYVDAVRVEEVTASVHDDITPMRGNAAIRLYASIYSDPRRATARLCVWV
ncbi:MAG TPA: hypothetical protein VHW25_01060 [Steroidobacteraceae bacterium]|jgi:hypothetical protein|nr:hypothetical protein [Steroidobacteraceae bacterium]